MTERKDSDFIYDMIDKIFRLSIGETGDFSGAKYDGDFSMSLEAAQRAKHKFMADSLNIEKGSKVLDMGCGWGPFLYYITKEREAVGIGLTLSESHARACINNGLNVMVKDCRYVKPEDFGEFDAIVCLGTFYHFCSVAEWKEGKQEEVYSNFFKTVYDLLPVGGRFCLETMTYSKNMLDYEDIDINAKKGSTSHVCALMMKEFPDSWLPYDPEMVIKNAEPYFKLISQSSGRLDYIETIRQWRKKFRKFNLKKYWLYLSLIPKYLTNKEFRHLVVLFRISPNRVCFEKEILDYARLVFEKI